jgi:hypothetical protein
MERIPIKSEDLPEKYKRIFDDMLTQEQERLDEKKLMKALQNAQYIDNKYTRLHKQWKDGQLPDKSTLDELLPAIEELEKHLKIFPDEKLDKSSWQFPSVVNTGQEVIGKIINRLNAFKRELEMAPTIKVMNIELPPVINAAIKEGLLEYTPNTNGKYSIRGDKKDSQFIEWIFDYTGYGDSLTTDLYMQHIQTKCKPTTIQDYITRKKKPAD